jgi:hypothetical protein
MTIMRSRHARLAALTLGLAAAASPMLSNPASAAANCTFKLVRVKAVDIQEERRGDEIYLHIDGERVPFDGYVTYTRNGESHPAADFGTAAQTQEAFNGSMTVKVFEQDPTFDEKIGVTHTVSCTGSATDHVLEFVEPNSAHYQVFYDVVLNSL